MDMHIHDVLNTSDTGDQAPIVILATHIIEDISELCTQMAVLNRGNEARTLPRTMNKAECHYEPAVQS